jgi:outer membrane protein OmpA-like peptidoglycan-associated protein
MLGVTAANAQNAGPSTGAGNDSVIVDLSVLDALPPAPADPSRPRGTVRLVPPAGVASPGNSTVRLRPPGGAPAAAPPRLTSAPPPPPPELLGDTASPPPAAEAAPAAKVSPAETAPMAEPKDAPPPSIAEPSPAVQPPAATTDKVVPEAAPPPPVAAVPPPAAEPPATAAREQPPSKAPPPPPATATTPDQSAAVPKLPKALSASAFGPGGTRAIAYAAGKADLPDDGQATLQAAVASLKADPALRILLKAYAGGGKESESRARRLSLSRALGVRSFLIKQGIEPTRIDVRALGSNVPDGSADRVDVSLVAR